jgi:glycosyltransferase involved in cell wall biosynthesis
LNFGPDPFNHLWPQMKIGVACATIGVIHRGGELQLAQLMQHLARFGHDVVMVTGGPSPVDGPADVVIRRTLRPVWEPLAQKRPRTGHAVARIDRWQFGLRAYAHLAPLRPDVVIPWEPPIHERLARLTCPGARMVSFGIGGPTHDAWRIAARPDLFVVSSVRAQRLAAGCRTAVIPPGVDLEAFAPDGERARLDLPRPIVGVFGALIPCKRVELAVAAVKRMREGSLLIVGSGPAKARILAAGEGLGPRLRLVEAVPAAQVPRLMRAIDVLCFPANEEETFGMVVVEAMAAGKPVVAADDEVRRGMIGDAGELCDATDAETLARTLERAAATKYPGPERARVFSWEAAARRLDEVLRELE